MHHRILLTITVPFLLAGPAVAQPPVVRELYHDFRTTRPVPDTFVVRGFNTDSEIKPEAEGLRFTLPAERGNHAIDEVFPRLQVAGDFEITATYEILSYKQPLKGFGVGVNLTISTETEPKKFGKLCRSIKAKEGSVYVAETWPKFKFITKPTDVMSGQLRLTRIGSVLYYLVTDGPGKEFEEIWKVDDYGGADLHFLGFQVMDSAEPNNPVDARLLDFRVRQGKLDLAAATAPAPLPALAVAARNVPPPAVQHGPGLTLFVLIAAVPLGFLMLLIVLVGVVFIFRQQRAHTPDGEPPLAERVIAFACPACGKQLKVKPDSAGKKLKCPKCSEAIVAPTVAAKRN